MIDSSMGGSLRIEIQTNFNETVFHAVVISRNKNSITLKKVLATMTHTLNIGLELEFIYSKVAATRGCY